MLSKFIAKETKTPRSYGTILSNIMNVISGRATSRLISKVFDLSTLHTILQHGKCLFFLGLTDFLTFLTTGTSFFKFKLFFFICISHLGDPGWPLYYIHLFCLIPSTCVHDQETMLLTHLLQETQISSSFPTGYCIKDGEWQSQR